MTDITTTPIAIRRPSLLRLELRDLLVLRGLGIAALLALLARVIRDTADDGGPCERPSSHTHVWLSPFAVRTSVTAAP